MPSNIDYGQILRMESEGYSKRKIALAVGCSRDTVARTLKAAEKTGVTIFESEHLDNLQLQERLFPHKGKSGDHAEPDFDYVQPVRTVQRERGGPLLYLVLLLVTLLIAR